MNVLKSENHLHLYGCIPAEQVYLDSHERITSQSSRFKWFTSEYYKTTGIEINPSDWHKTSGGFEIFKKQFICNDQTTFDIFQAKFNLLIALYPPNPDDMTLPSKVFQAHATSGGYKEYRTFLPLYLPYEERTRYLKNLILTAKAYENSTYHPRIAISFSRTDADAWESYRFLMAFLNTNPQFGSYITGVDFCGNERGHPPSVKKSLFSEILRDRSKGLHALDILYHVGEMWDSIALHSATRWCMETSMLGVKRLGHALALGLNPNALLNRRILEPRAEAKSHLAWLLHHRDLLQDFNYTSKDYAWLTKRIESSSSATHIEWFYDSDLIEHTRVFQDACLKAIKMNEPIIETCPTSNIRIGALGGWCNHPLSRFLEHELDVTISTDDPGIFGISLDSEEHLSREIFNLSESALQQMESRTRSLFLR